jgi:dihydroflavonol-4-reductase
MSEVFITGGTGLVGSFIVRRYLQAGFRVKVLRRLPHYHSLLDDVDEQIHWVEGNILDTVLLRQALAGCETVIHAAAEVSFNPRNTDLLTKINREGTANLVNASLLAGVKKFCFVSSVAALGAGQQAIINENIPWEENKFTTAYGKSKHQAEQEVWRGMAEGLEAVIVNPSLVLGAGDWHRSSTRLFRYAWREPLFYPPGDVNCIDVRDVAEVIFQLMQSEISGERFILSAHHLTFGELLAKMAFHFGKKEPKTALSPFWLKMLAYAESWRSRFTGSQPLISAETARASRRSLHYNTEKIQKTLGFSFRDLEETLAWACQELTEKEENTAF